MERKVGAKPASLAATFPAQNKTVELPKTESVSETKTETAPVPTESPQPIVETKTAESPIKTEPAPSPEVKKETENQEPKVETLPEVKIEKAPDETKPPIENPVSENKSKPLFEPVVISVPKVEPVKKPEQTKPVEPAAPKVDAPKVDVPKTTETVAEKKPLEDTESRPRVVVSAAQPETVAPPQCKIIAGQETVLINNNGGNLSILLRLEGEISSNEIKAVSSSPADVEVLLEPEFGKPTNRSYFAVKSISRKTGAFTLTFESACGKKEILVKVR